MFELKKEILATQEAKLTVTINPEAERKAYQQALRKIGRSVSIPGFRKGRAPRGIIERRFGKETILREAAEDLLEKISDEIFEQADVIPYRQGELDDISFSPITFVIRVPLAPEVELGDYQSIRREWEPVEVTEEELAQSLDELREENVMLEPVTRPAELEDELEILSFHGAADEDIFVDEEDTTLLLSEADEIIAPGVGDALVGIKTGEEKTFTLTLPEDFEGEAWQNREVTFKVKVAEVYERTLPELNDALASTVGNFESLDELKEKLQEEMLAHKEQHAEEEYTEELITALVDGAELRYPPVMVEEEIDDMLSQLRKQFEEAGIDWEQFQAMQGEQATGMREGMRAEAEMRIERGLALNEFSQEITVGVTDEEVLAEFEAVMASRGIEDPALLSGFDANSELGNNIRNSLYGRKVLEQLRLLAQGELNLDAEEAEETKVVAEPEPEPEAE